MRKSEYDQIAKNTTKNKGAAKVITGLALTSLVFFGIGTFFKYKELRRRCIAEDAPKKRAVGPDAVYTVNMDGKSEEGLIFKKGDTFRILEANGDAGLIEKIGDVNNPYFVSLDFLSHISDYELN